MLILSTNIFESSVCACTAVTETEIGIIISPSFIAVHTSIPHFLSLLLCLCVHSMIITPDEYERLSAKDPLLDIITAGIQQCLDNETLSGLLPHSVNSVVLAIASLLVSELEAATKTKQVKSVILCVVWAYYTKFSVFYEGLTLLLLFCS